MARVIRQGRADDAAFIAHTVLLSQRGPRPLGWFDFALAQAEPQVLDFLAKLAVAKPRSWYHVSQFLIAEVEDAPAAALCAMPSRETRDKPALTAPAKSCTNWASNGSMPRETVLARHMSREP